MHVYDAIQSPMAIGAITKSSSINTAKGRCPGPISRQWTNDKIVVQWETSGPMVKQWTNGKTMNPMVKQWIQW